jgi:hypothetical protein
MKRVIQWIVQWIVLPAALLAPAASFAQVACTREGLEAAANLYITAQGKGDPSGMPLAKGLDYIENLQVVDIQSGVPIKAIHMLSARACE